MVIGRDTVVHVENSRDQSSRLTYVEEGGSIIL